MPQKSDIFLKSATAEERLADETLRPKKLSEFVGQEKLKKKLSTYIDAAKARGEPIDHIIFYGPPGLGKTTLAHIIANEIGANIRATAGPILERPADLVGLLTSLARGDILFIDEIHRTPRNVEEFLYPAMEDYCLDIVIDKGPNARTVKLNLEHFTLIGSTTRAGLITAPLRSRFGIVERLDYYSPEELLDIVIRSARIMEIDIERDGALEIARRARGTPRIANRILRRIRDFAQVHADGIITADVAQAALDMLEIDSEGLDEMDKRILSTIIKNFAGGPVGIKTIAVAVGEDEGTIEELYEPYLIQRGFLARTQRGRIATKLAYKHLGLSIITGNTLFD
ncbi:Holliday junction branch migration DNA helicase RuvB [bacterium]|nr:Holliday junction branch migration DNA helicase RuvB [bacterium]